MNNRPKQLFNLLIQIKKNMGIFAHVPLSIFLYSHPSIHKDLINRKFSDYLVGAHLNYKKNILILLMLLQQLYFVYDDAIYDVIVQEPV